MSDPLEIARTTIKGLAAVIGNQRRELERLHWERDSAVEKYEKLRNAAATYVVAIKRHDPACHVETCPQIGGCESRDGGIDFYDWHDCTCGLDAVRSALYMTLLRPPYYDTDAERHAANRAKLEENMKHFTRAEEPTPDTEVLPIIPAGRDPLQRLGKNEP